MIDIKENIAFIRSLAEWDTAKVSDSDSAQRLAHQMICVALNYDIDTLSSLATAAVPKEGSDDEQRFYLSVFADLCLFTHSVIAGKNMEVNDDPDD